MEAASPADQAKKLGLTYAGWGKWMDDSGDIVAKTVNGELVKLTAPEPAIDDDDDDTYELPDLGGDGDYQKGGHWNYQPSGAPGINPGWNKGMTLAGDDSSFDANADETVQKLLAKVGDPGKLMRWLVKKFKEESANGKKRIAQYIGILKKMGFDEEGDGEGAGTVPQTLF